jgi:hypothetical protein
MLGDSNPANFTTVSIAYDPSGNANSAFNGNGNEVLFRNGASFATPTSANTAFHLNTLVLKDGNVGIGVATPSTTLEVNGSISHTNGGAFKSIEFLKSISASTSAANLYTVTTSNANRAVFYEIIIFGGDWSGRSAARTVKRGFFCPNGLYTAHNVIESSGLYAANITLGYSQSGNAFTTTLTLDGGGSTLDCHIRLVGDISSYS